MKIGVVIIAYNFGDYLDEAVRSALTQTRKPDAVVVVDDGSTNETRAQVASLPERYRGVRAILAEHGGQPHARNTGIRALKDVDAVLCLDGDDRLKVDALELLAGALEADPTAGLAYGWVEKFGSETGVTQYEPWDAVQLMDHNFVQPSACLFRRSLWEKTGGWSTHLQQAVGGFDDWAFCIAAAEAGSHGVLVPAPVVEYRRHEGADFGRMRRTDAAARAALSQRHLWRYLSTYGPRVAALGPGGVVDPRKAIEVELAACDRIKAELAARGQLVADAAGAAASGGAAGATSRKFLRPFRRAARPLRAAARRAVRLSKAADLGPVPVRVGPPPIPKLPVLQPPLDGMWPSVDVVSVLYNSAEHIERFAASLHALDYPRDRIHFFFVDNASSDGCGDALRARVADLPHSFVRLGQNTGFTGGNNVALRASRADFVFLLNPDAVAEAASLKTLVMRAMQERGIGMVEAAMQPLEHPKDYDPETQETSWCSGAAVLVSRSALQRTGVFDERFFMYCEDIDLSWRMWTHGYRCVYEPRARVEHGQGVAVHKGGERGYYLSLRNGLMMRLVFGGARSYARYAAALVGLALAPGQSRRARTFPIRALGAHLRHLPHLVARRNAQAERPVVPVVTFYGWDYHVRRW